MVYPLNALHRLWPMAPVSGVAENILKVSYWSQQLCSRTLPTRRKLSASDGIRAIPAQPPEGRLALLRPPHEPGSRQVSLVRGAEGSRPQDGNGHLGNLGAEKDSLP